MSQLLDLSITLDPPPAEAAPEIIASITLRCEALGLTLSGGLLTNPITQQEREELLWYLIKEAYFSAGSLLVGSSLHNSWATQPCPVHRD